MHIQEYTDNMFKPFINRQLESVRKIDVNADVYQDDSLENATREKRGSGAQRKVLLSTHISSNWQSFLRVDNTNT